MDQDISNFVDILREQRKSILDEWMKRRKENAEREKIELKSKKSWMDHIPELFNRILDSLVADDEETKGLGEDHGKQRRDQGINLAESILDLNLLEEILYDRIASITLSKDSKTPSPEAVNEIHRTIAKIVNQCTVETSYSFLRHEEERYRLRENQLGKRITSLGTEIQKNLKIVGGSAHDLKGSMEILVRLAETAIQKGGQTPETAALLAALTKGLTYNQRILEDLFILSFNRPIGPPEALRASDIIQDISTRIILGFGASDSRIQFTNRAEIDLWMHRIALERVISNLIDNAFAHGDDSEISVGWEYADEEKTLWLFTIENGLREPLPENCSLNTWCGEPEFIEEGLGLSVVAQTVDFMNGDLQFFLSNDNRLKIQMKLPCRVEVQSEWR